jgi:DNA modification methylase
MRRVFREVHRVLKPTGTLWLNIGDSYAGSSMTGGNASLNAEGGEDGYKMQRQFKKPGAGRASRKNIYGKHAAQGIEPMTNPDRAPVPDLKQKDLVGIPWRVAFALQADGWWLRQDIIWHKPNPMPESITDRATKAHEYLFLLAKSERYHFDQEAWKEPCGSGESDLRKMREGLPRIGGKHKALADPLVMASSLTNVGRKRSVGDGQMRNRRSVWTIGSEPTSEAHFACFPQALVDPCILAGCPKDGVVLDTFCGSGTTLAVANRLGRSGIGLELNPQYIEIARRRIFADVTPTRQEKAMGQKLLPIGEGT